ncbi:MAG TPA: ATP synthase subunit I [Acidobacteriota bacterium]|nr:ATP synthase subunit I [Acidobacteriota bacterium]
MIEWFDVLKITTALIGGILLGAFYFGGLWWTIQRMPGSRRPLRLYFASLAFRLIVICASFYLVLILAGGLALVACLVTLIAARTLLIRQVGLRALD